MTSQKLWNVVHGLSNKGSFSVVRSSRPWRKKLQLGWKRIKSHSFSDVQRNWLNLERELCFCVCLLACLSLVGLLNRLPICPVVYLFVCLIICLYLSVYSSIDICLYLCKLPFYFPVHILVYSSVYLSVGTLSISWLFVCLYGARDKHKEAEKREFSFFPLVLLYFSFLFPFFSCLLPFPWWGPFFGYFLHPILTLYSITVFYILYGWNAIFVPSCGNNAFSSLFCFYLHCF